MANRRNQFHSLWDKTKQKAFGEAMLHAYRRWQYHVIVVTIDKKAHLAQYGEWHRPPYVYCLQVLMERYILFLRGKKATGDVMIEARGKREDKELAQAYGDFSLVGSGFVSPDTWQNHLTTKQIKINPKQDNIAGLQLADLLAHPAHYDVLFEHGKVEEQTAIYSSEIVKILRESKYHRSFDNRIVGYGMKLLP